MVWRVLHSAENGQFRVLVDVRNSDKMATAVRAENLTDRWVQVHLRKPDGDVISPQAGRFAPGETQSRNIPVGRRFKFEADQADDPSTPDVDESDDPLINWALSSTILVQPPSQPVNPFD
jgi:hypothetical protein